MVKFILNDLLRQIYVHMKVYYTARKVIKNIKTVSGDALENSLDWFLAAVSGAPNETIVQNHINIALLNVL